MHVRFEIVELDIDMHPSVITNFILNTLSHHKVGDLLILKDRRGLMRIGIVVSEIHSNSYQVMLISHQVSNMFEALLHSDHGNVICAIHEA